MSYKPSIIKSTKNSNFSKIINRINSGRILLTCCALLFTIIPEALAIDLNAAGKAFFEPVVAFSKAYTPMAIFLGGIAGLAFTPGELKTKAIGSGAGMAVAGLLVKAAEKGFNIV